MKKMWVMTRAEARFDVASHAARKTPSPLAVGTLKRRERRAPLTLAGRLQTSSKIITALFTAMVFDGGMTWCKVNRDLTMFRLPACLGGGFGGLIGKQNQPGAGL
jgi:hypothetical protein